MPALAELQLGIAQSLLARDAAGRAAPERWFCDGEAARDGLRIHRNTVIGACWNALRLSYPLLERWLGAPAFEALAADYAREHPPQAATLTAYGESFADFAVSHVAVADRALARDLAAFDWAFERVALAAPEAVGGIAHPMQPRMSMNQLASLRWLEVTHAIDDLRDCLETDLPLPDPVPWAPGHLALWRTPDGVRLRRLPPAAAAHTGVTP